jgi:hypothetical protein
MVEQFQIISERKSLTTYNKSKETNKKPASGFFIAHFKR